jgi:pimeloyl-ACP methyl ester carboxylesterase
MKLIEHPWSFASQGDTCVGYQLRPADVQRPPAIIMAPGLGGQISVLLRPFAERFAQRGLAACLFDYRGFGKSTGVPRGYVHPWRHLQDWEAALQTVQDDSTIDRDRIALWGTSFSGGHVVVIAAQHPEVRAIAAQVPFADGVLSAKTSGARDALRYSRAVLRDVWSTITRRGPHYIAVAGAPGTTAVTNQPGVWEFFVNNVPESHQAPAENECPARILAMVPFYRPTKYAPRVQCPALVIAAERDSLIPIASVEEMANRIPRATFMRLPLSHFEVYLGDGFDTVVNSEADFFASQLL